MYPWHSIPGKSKASVESFHINFQPLNFTLLTNPTEGTPVADFKPELMKNYWDQGFKINFLKYLNNNYNPSFVIPSQTFAFIDPLL
jgi:hypothetical protein